MNKIFLLIFIFLLQTGFAKNSSYIVLDAKTNKVLSGEHIEDKLPIASLTKIWVALIVIENSNLDAKVKISKKASYQEGSSIYLKENQICSVRDLLYGMLLRSGNDAAVALAEHVFGSEKEFVKVMNKRLKEVGIKNTNFVNVTGFDDKNHFSTAKDVAEMLNIALKNYKFKGISSSINYKNSLTGETWKNKHKLLGEQSVLNHTTNLAFSGKTGFTKIAGRTLATAFVKDENIHIVVTLNEPNDWKIHQVLADKTYKNKKKI
ncbi:D-alanyl-D-alanine carboxypeptidase family protein [Aliarcobacter butzleri]